MTDDVSPLQDVTLNDIPVNLAMSDMSPISGDTMTSGDTNVSFPKPGCTPHVRCESSRCSNHGNCVDLWTRNECNCQPGFVGPQCSRQTMAHFSGPSFLQFGGQADITDISLWISTTKESGIILYTVSIA